MSLENEENIYTAARRLLTCVNIDSQGGGLLSIETEKAAARLQIQIDIERKRIKALEIEDANTQSGTPT